MLKNEKVLSNNGKIIKGTHLESFIFFDNAPSTTVSFSYSTNNLATPQNPLNIYFYDDDGFNLISVTSSVTDVTASYYNSSGYGTDRYVIFYGNTDALTKFETPNNNQRINGDLKGFLNEFSNLETLKLNEDRLSGVNLDYFKWNGKIKKIDLDDSDLSGDFGTMTGLENLEHLELDGTTTNIGGDISNLDALTYLNIYGQYNNNIIQSDIGQWDFISNLTYLRLWRIHGIYGDMSNITFNSGLTELDIYELNNSNLEGDLSNWDLSQCSVLTRFNLGFGYSSDQNIIGSTSGWTFHDDVELNNFTIRSTYMTDLSIDLSNITSLYSLFLYSNSQASNDIANIKLPNNNSVSNITMSGLGITGNIEDFVVPDNYDGSILITSCNSLQGDCIGFINNYLATGVTSINIYNNYSLSGNISGLTLWDGQSTCNIRGNNITGTLSPITIPDSFNWLAVSDNNISVDLSSEFDFNNTSQIYFQNMNSFSGDFSNLKIPDVTYLTIYSNTFNMDFGDIPVNWEIIQTLRANNCTLNVSSDLSNFFSGSTSSIRSLYLNDTDYTGNVTNWNMGNWGGYNFNSYCYLYNSDLSGDLGQWGTPIPRNFFIYGSDIGGDIGSLDYTTLGSERLVMGPSNLSGDLSGVTLDYRIRNFEIGFCTGVTGSDSFVDYIWTNRKNWTASSFSIIISNLGDSVSGTYQLGDLGTYGGDFSDLTEAEINNLVDGNDYDGGGSNTPWTQAEKIYYMENANISSSSSTKKYKCNDWTY